MYENIKSIIITSEGTSAYFLCCTGVRQGENMSPFLFSIYLNDLERYLLSNYITGVTCEVNDEFIYVYLKLYILLYAGGGRVVRRCWVNFQCRGVLLIWIIVGQGPVALAVGAGGGCLDIFSLISPFSPLSPSLWETARYRLKYCLKGPLNPKPTNQPIYFTLMIPFYLVIAKTTCNKH